MQLSIGCDEPHGSKLFFLPKEIPYYQFMNTNEHFKKM
jgi:hypothetical protein